MVADMADQGRGGWKGVWQKLSLLSLSLSLSMGFFNGVLGFVMAVWVAV